MKKLQGDMDVFRVDFLTFKEVQVAKIDNIDIIFKKVANESFSKVRDVEAELRLIKDDFMKLTNENIRETAALYEKLGQIQNEIIEIKNEKKALTNLRSRVHWASDASAKVEALVEETNNLYFMIQRFIDEHAVDRIKQLRSQEVTLKDKMNIMDWLARNSDFLSADPIQDCIQAFKELYNTENATLKNAYIFAKHSSNVIQTIVGSLEQYQKQTRDEEVSQKLTILFSILEPLLINDQNLDKALSMQGVVIITKFLDRNSITDKPSIFVKYLIRCLTSCLRQDQGIISALATGDFVEKMIEIVRTINDEEMVANACKCIRIACRDDHNLDALVKRRKDIANVLIETLNVHAYSDAISQEILSVRPYNIDLCFVGSSQLYPKERIHHPYIPRKPQSSHRSGQDIQERKVNRLYI